MFIPIDQVLAPTQRSTLTIQPTSFLPTPMPPAPRYRRKQKPSGEQASSTDKTLRADQSYNEARHMAYLAVIQEAYKHVSMEG